MARQGRRLRHPGARRQLHPLPVRKLLRRGRAAVVRDGAVAARVRLAAVVTAQVLVACSPGEVRIAVVADDELLDYAIWRPGAPDGVGDLHRGRVTTRVPAMAGSFVALD